MYARWTRGGVGTPRSRHLWQDERGHGLERSRPVRAPISRLIQLTRHRRRASVRVGIEKGRVCRSKRSPLANFHARGFSNVQTHSSRATMHSSRDISITQELYEEVVRHANPAKRAGGLKGRLFCFDSTGAHLKSL